LSSILTFVDESVKKTNTKKTVVVSVLVLVIAQLNLLFNFDI
jgi:hypothetical protein